MEIKEGFVICDSYKKEEIIRNSKGFKNYIFLSFNDLSSRVLGSCKKEAIFLLVDKYALSYEEAKEYIKYIPYVENKSYNNLKLDSILLAKILSSTSINVTGNWFNLKRKKSSLENKLFSINKFLADTILSSFKLL